MKQQIIAKVVLGIVFLALAIQLTFVIANAVGKDKAITSQAKAVLGITW